MRVVKEFIQEKYGSVFSLGNNKYISQITSSEPMEQTLRSVEMDVLEESDLVRAFWSGDFFDRLK